MDLSTFSATSVYELVYTIGEILTTTWTGRLVLGMAFGSVLARIARL